jgi:predicted DNA-binding transcriptional regulator YafY
MLLVNRTEHRPAATLPPVTLTPEEAAAVAVALAARPDGPFAGDGRSALEKVLAALEPDPRRRADLLASSEQVGTEAGRQAGIRSAVERAVSERRVAVLEYRDGRGAGSHRTVEPQLLVRSSRHWFLVAWCRERRALRWFRADRIADVQVTAETAPRRELSGLGPPPADTHPAGRALSGAVPAARTGPPATPAPLATPRLVVLPGGRT